MRRPYRRLRSPDVRDLQLANMELDIFEKIVLTEGMIDGGRKPATIRTSAAASSEYSIISWPSSPRQSNLSTFCIRVP